MRGATLVCPVSCAISSGSLRQWWHFFPARQDLFLLFTWPNRYHDDLEFQPTDSDIAVAAHLRNLQPGHDLCFNFTIKFCFQVKFTGQSRKLIQIGMQTLQNELFFTRNLETTYTIFISFERKSPFRVLN